MLRILLSLFLVAFASNALAQNYNATAGAGLTFGANLVGGVLYPQQNMCDPTTPARCVVVDASGRITLAPNQSVNVAQINGVTVLMGNGATGTGSQRVTLSNDNTIPTGWPTAANQASQITQETAINTVLGLQGDSVCGSATGTCTLQALIKFLNNAAISSIPAGTNLIGDVNLRQGGNALSATNGAFVNVLQGNAVLSQTNPSWSRVTDGTRAAVIDPCEANAQTYAPISITTATTTRIVAPSASNKTYICSLFLTSAAADNVGIVEGTGGTCGTGTAGVIGGTTAANGPNFAANGGMFLQAGGKTAVAQTAGTNVDLCLITSAATPLAGGIRYVQAP